MAVPHNTPSKDRFPADVVLAQVIISDQRLVENVEVLPGYRELAGTVYVVRDGPGQDRLFFLRINMISAQLICIVIAKPQMVVVKSEAEGGQTDSYIGRITSGFIHRHGTIAEFSRPIVGDVKVTLRIRGHHYRIIDSVRNVPGNGRASGQILVNPVLVEAFPNTDVKISRRVVHHALRLGVGVAEYSIWILLVRLIFLSGVHTPHRDGVRSRGSSRRAPTWRRRGRRRCALTARRKK